MLALGWLGIIFSLSAHAVLKPVSEGLQTLIVRLYSEGQCSEAFKSAIGIDPNQLTPNVMAIVAYCAPVNYDSNRLFEKAESLSPTGDLILFLHAKHQWKKDHAKAEPLWQRVLLIARNDYFRRVAKDYLADIIDDEDQDVPLDLSPHTTFLEIFLGGSHRTNAQPEEFVFLPNASSLGELLRADFTYRHWSSIGSQSAYVKFAYERYPSALQYNALNSQIEVPMAIHVASAKDLIFRPFLNYSRLGSQSLRSVYGVGIMAAVYKSAFKQSVQGIISKEQIFADSIRPEEGSHYRFEYAWEFNPKDWVLTSVLAVEHVSGSPTYQFLGSTGLFPMSHNDIAIDVNLERDFGKFSLGMAPRILYRLDTESTHFYANQASSGTSVVRLRHDWNYALQGSVSIPLVPSVQIYGWYEWKRILSSLQSGDYVNYNYSDQTVGLGLKAILSSY